MKTLTAALIFFFAFFSSFSQSNGIGVGTSTPHASAQLDVTSTSKGFLPPRMTWAQRNAISNPSPGLIIWCSNCLPKGELQIFNGTEWTTIMGTEAAVSYVQIPSVTIGNQVWALKNLDVSTFNNGDPIPQVTDLNQWKTITTPAWCWYQNDSTLYGTKYGRLYNWYTINDSRGICPTGWHVSTDAEWNTLIQYLDPSATLSSSGTQSLTAGGNLKNTTLWNSPNTGASNSSGFSALPSGYRGAVDGVFYQVGTNTFFWTSTATIPTNPFAWYLSTNNAQIGKSGYSKSWGFPIRCVRD